MRKLDKDTFLTECRDDRTRFAGFLKACEDGVFHVGGAKIGGPIVDETPAYMDHLRRVIAELDALIASIEAEGT